MANNRNVRAQESRSNSRVEDARPDTAWKPPSLLDAPDPRPGMVQRWIATSIQGRETPDNVYKRMRAGWNPRPADTVKDQRYPTINHGQWAGSIGIEGMILCEMPEDKFKSMKAYYNEKAEEQNESIPGELDAMARTGGIPIHQDRKSSSSQGRDISVMADD
jgi:hypothetical protein|tara:strand:+ start:16507 stop:16992 length:486 start_codon:yes stop_codon:yes gene_type:complete